MRPIGIYKETSGEFEVFHISGDLDADSASQIEKRLLDSVSIGRKKLVVDFQNLDSINKAGLQTLFQMQKHIKASEGEMVLTSLNERVMEVFAIAGLDSFFTLAESEDEAKMKMKKS